MHLVCRWQAGCCRDALWGPVPDTAAVPRSRRSGFCAIVKAKLELSRILYAVFRFSGLSGFRVGASRKRDSPRPIACSGGVNVFAEEELPVVHLQLVGILEIVGEGLEPALVLVAADCVVTPNQPVSRSRPVLGRPRWHLRQGALL